MHELDADAGQRSELRDRKAQTPQLGQDETGVFAGDVAKDQITARPACRAGNVPDVVAFTGGWSESVEPSQSYAV